MGEVAEICGRVQPWPLRLGLRDNKSIWKYNQRVFNKVESRAEPEKEENQGVEDVEIVEVPATDRENTMSIQNGSTVNIRFFSARHYHQVDLFVRIKQIEGLTIHLSVVGLSHAPSFRT